ncbi:hypothetical protein BABA_09756 [Neobacillus bataviensis LMG 21833]|uniref:Uncharacterized protein n=1 Tax=Neobacillus bataviensis LMG 21833 TaxID=1117379 RepID=K6CEY6_9BACI|nr:hypothetical protein [Neobacillus bataviensis]EKN69700.1 hypothetical protein BABA_09756 [Neobacillus bataviensis LMG 21833]
MTDRELLEGIFSELKEVRKDTDSLYSELKEVRKDLDRIEKEVRKDIEGLDKKVEVQTEILMTFKYDIDFINEKQAKQDLKINRISKQLEV